MSYTVRILRKPQPDAAGTPQEDLPLPQQMSEGAAGFDVVAANLEVINLAPGERALVPCGFAMAMPKGLECQVRPRSGLALKHGVTVLNAPGTIDCDYRGEVRVLLINHGQDNFAVERGERIAQLVFKEVTTAKLQLVLSLDDTSRGVNGFGSTGER